jgi:NAD(P)-dependent dehydrogenase (short-subunit alcohol dehydrogenase family)
MRGAGVELHLSGKVTADHSVRPVQVDLGTPQAPGRVIEGAGSAFGGLDILVNNTGAVIDGGLVTTL